MKRFTQARVLFVLLIAFQVANGQSVQWKLRTNGEIRSNLIRSNLVLHNNQLFLAGGNGVLSCIDKVSGMALWRVIFDNAALFLSEIRFR